MTNTKTRSRIETEIRDSVVGCSLRPPRKVDARRPGGGAANALQRAPLRLGIAGACVWLTAGEAASEGTRPASRASADWALTEPVKRCVHRSSRREARAHVNRPLAAPRLTAQATSPGSFLQRGQRHTSQEHLSAHVRARRAMVWLIEPHPLFLHHSHLAQTSTGCGALPHCEPTPPLSRQVGSGRARGYQHNRRRRSVLRPRESDSRTCRAGGVQRAGVARARGVVRARARRPPLLLLLLLPVARAA
jgi:hypothetical protein